MSLGDVEESLAEVENTLDPLPPTGSKKRNLCVPQETFHLLNRLYMANS